MNPITVPMLAKTTQPVLTYFLLAAVAATFVCVCYMMFRHQRRVRKDKKLGRSPHTGRRGNH